MQARTSGNVEGLIENAADFRRRQRVGAKAEGAEPQSTTLAEDLETADLLQPAANRSTSSTSWARILACPVPAHTGRRRRAQPRRAHLACRLRGNREAPSAASRWTNRRRYPLAPGPHGRPRTDVQRPGAGGTQQRLVAGKRQQIDVQRPHIDGHGPGGLGGIEQKQSLIMAQAPSAHRR